MGATGTSTGGNAAAATGGQGGTATAAATTGGAGNGGVGNGAVGGAGGAGGSISVSAGTFDLSNAMTGTAQSAAGILAIVQNTGIGALAQQSVNVQANLSLGK